LPGLVKAFIDMNRRACARVASHLPHTKAHIFAAYEQTAGQCASTRPGQLVVDIGGGAQCVFLHRCTVEPRIVTLDISQEELKRNQNVEAKVVADASRALPFADASVDVVLSSCVVEHLPDVDGFLAEAIRILRPGGSSIHMFPSKYAPFVFANRALPHSFARKLLYFFHPSQKGLAGFRAYYDHCSAAQFESLLEKHGLEPRQLRLSYFQSDYVNFFLPLFLVSVAYEAVVSALGLESLCAFVLCVAVKSSSERLQLPLPA
jgi:2-polyprenyl-6-hydroxyphenyl methylase/3-demethylubiquinone-9 3-methyltransferase